MNRSPDEPAAIHQPTGSTALRLRTGDYGPTTGGHGPNARITLSPEQRAFAAEQGIPEVEYARQLLKLQQMKRAGIIRD